MICFIFYTKNWTPYQITKIGDPWTWDAHITQLVIKFLAHSTPPSCVILNILSAKELLLPNTPIVTSYQVFGLCDHVALYCYMWVRCLVHMNLHVLSSLISCSQMEWVGSILQYRMLSSKSFMRMGTRKTLCQPVLSPRMNQQSH